MKWSSVAQISLWRTSIDRQDRVIISMNGLYPKVEDFIYNYKTLLECIVNDNDNGAWVVLM
jgi:hypothetical protein